MDRGRPHLVQEAGFADWRSIYGDVDNVAAAMIAACVARTLPHRVYNVGDAVLSMREIVERVQSFAGWEGRYLTPSRKELPDALREPWRVEHWLAIDTSRIRRDFEWEPAIGLDETFRRTLAWEREVRDGPKPDLLVFPQHPQHPPLLLREAELVENEPKSGHYGIQRAIQHHGEGLAELLDCHDYPYLLIC